MQLNYKERFLLNLYKERSANKKKDWDTDNFPKQNNFVNSKALRVAAQCTRRAGKSYGVGKKLIKTAEDNPGCNVLYIALTRDSAERILYKDILREIFKDRNIKYKPNSTKLTFTLSNGSVIKLAGADQSDKEMEKLLGGKYKLAAIDEAAFFKQDLRKLIEEILEPALIDEEGQLYLISTTSHNVHSFYYQIVTGKVKGWEVHKWTSYDNPTIADKWAKAVDQKLKDNPDIIHTPAYKRMYLNLWVIDQELQVYKIHETCLIEKLPPLQQGAKWHFGLGVDLGWNDETAFVVTAWNKYDSVLYIIAKYKKAGMDFIEVGEYINTLKEHYKSFYFIVVDNASKQGVETMRNRCKINFIAAEKSGKRDFIEIFNGEMLAGKVKVVSNIAFNQGNFEHGKEYEDELMNEWSNLVWHEELYRKGVYEELSSCPNHLADACLYNWRHAFNHTAVAIPKPKIKVGSEEYMYQEALKNKKQNNLDFEFENDMSIYNEPSFGNWGANE